MTFQKHIIVSGVTSALFFSMTHSWVGGMSCFLSGILIDVDHQLDFYLHRKRICLSLKELMHFCLKERTGKMYLIFHSYELMVFWWLVAVFLHFDPVWLGMALGMSVHMLFDQLTNPVYPWAYFWFCRRRFQFNKKIFFNDDFLEELKLAHKNSNG
jgi:hypothetical protein